MLYSILDTFTTGLISGHILPFVQVANLVSVLSHQPSDSRPVGTLVTSVHTCDIQNHLTRDPDTQSQFRSATNNIYRILLELPYWFKADFETIFSLFGKWHTPDTKDICLQGEI